MRRQTDEGVFSVQWSVEGRDGSGLSETRMERASQRSRVTLISMSPSKIVMFTESDQRLKCFIPRLLF